MSQKYSSLRQERKIAVGKDVGTFIARCCAQLCLPDTRVKGHARLKFWFGSMTSTLLVQLAAIASPKFRCLCGETVL